MGRGRMRRRTTTHTHAHAHTHTRTPPPPHTHTRKTKGAMPLEEIEMSPTNSQALKASVNGNLFKNEAPCVFLSKYCYLTYCYNCIVVTCSSKRIVTLLSKMKQR